MPGLACEAPHMDDFLERCATQNICWLLIVYGPRESDPGFVLRRASVMGTAVVLGAMYLAFNSPS